MSAILAPAATSALENAGGFSSLCDEVEGCIVPDGRDYNGCNNYLLACSVQTCLPGLGCAVEPIDNSEVDYQVMSYAILSNGSDWRIIRTLGLPRIVAQETAAKGTSASDTLSSLRALPV